MRRWLLANMWHAVAPLVALVYLLAVGGYARYMADDFTYTVQLRTSGLPADQLFWYVHWSGRYSATLASSLAEWAGAWDIPLVLYTVTALWLWALWRLCGPLGPLLIVATLAAAPNLAQSFYWQTGLLSYVVPLAFGTLAARAIAAKQPWRAAVLSFVAGGFSETYVSAQTMVLAVTAVYCWQDGQPLLRPVLSGLCGSVVALTVMAAAPGNALRAATLPHTVSVPAAFVHSAIDAATLLDRLLPMLLLVVMAGLLVASCRPVPRVWLLILPAGTLLVTIASIAPAWYEASASLPDRGQIVPIYFSLCGAAAWGWALRSLLGRLVWPRYLRAPLLLLVVLCSAAAGVAQGISYAHRAAPYAAAWDRRDRQLRQGEMTTISLYNPFGLAEPADKGNTWPRTSLLAYYYLHGAH